MLRDHGRAVKPHGSDSVIERLCLLRVRVDKRKKNKNQELQAKPQSSVNLKEKNT